MKEANLNWSMDTFSKFIREHDIRYADIHIENRANHAKAYDSKTVCASDPGVKIIRETEPKHGYAVKADAELNSAGLIITAYETYPARINIKEVTKAVKDSGGFPTAIKNS